MRIFLIFCSFGISLFGCTNSGKIEVEINEETSTSGVAYFKIKTKNATYLYEKQAGGFASIIDNNGIDWIQFHKSDSGAKFPASAAADYRGLPNLVHKGKDSGCGHPGFQKMSSVKINDHTISSTSLSGKWSWTWIFYDDFAELTIDKADTSRAYWFLYEGPIGGNFSPKTHFWGTNNLEKNISDADLIRGSRLTGNWDIVYFGDQNVENILFLHQLTTDKAKDMMAYMGNSKELANASKDGMVVFGFGRSPMAKPGLSGLNRFRIGFIETKDRHQDILNDITSKKI